MKFQDDKYYDAQGKQTADIEQAHSKVEFRPFDFRFYVKRTIKPWFSEARIEWVYHHTSSTFGAWMWPEGMPLRFDGSDINAVCIEHARKIKSDWFSNPA